MSATYTWDIFSTLDGYGSYGPDGDWGGYWGKEGPELLAHRFAQYEGDQRMVYGANTFREFVEPAGLSTTDPDAGEDWFTRLRSKPTTAVSSTLEGPFDWPDAAVADADAVDVVARLKAASDVPLRSHGSMRLNRALLAAGLVDRLQVTVFPVVSGRTGDAPLFRGAADFDLELRDSRTFDGRTQELTRRPTVHTPK